MERLDSCLLYTSYRDDWQVTTPATCTKEGVETRYCHNNSAHVQTLSLIHIW